MSRAVCTRASSALPGPNKRHSALPVGTNLVSLPKLPKAQIQESSPEGRKLSGSPAERALLLPDLPAALSTQHARVCTLGEGLVWAQPEVHGLLLPAHAGKKQVELGVMASLASVSHANELGKLH